MQDSKYSADSFSGTSSEGDIEMENLDDVVVTPNSHLPPNNAGHIPYSHQNNSHGHQNNSYGDEEWDDGDEGRRALLGSQNIVHEHLPVREHKSLVRRLWPKIQSIVIESAPTLLLTTIGLLFTGEILDHVSHWRAMQQVNELIIIIPVILNLKGNLEMNLSARLGTAANIGELDKPQARRSIILGNLALLQVQATVVSFVAACVSLFLGLVLPHLTSSSGISGDVPAASSAQNTTSLIFHRAASRRPRPLIPSVDHPKSGLTEFVMVSSSAMTAACLSSLLLGSFMCGLVILCRYVGGDPDNIAPPIAACLGDLVTLCLLGLISAILINFVNTPIPLILMILIILSSLSCLLLTFRNPMTKDLLKQGWSPLFGAMIISSCTGIVLDLFVTRYEDFALLAVVISGLPGSVGSIFVSRLSTALHAAALALPSLPDHNTFLASKRPEQPSPRLVMITLLLITLPVEIIFLSFLRGVGWLNLPLTFISFSVVFFCGAVTTSLFLAKFLTDLLWSKNLDPDMYALPIHSALMDLVGQLLLVLCFELVSLMGVHVEKKSRS